LQQVLGVLGLYQAELEPLPKNAPEKMVLAWWLRQHTTVALCWVSVRLAMGHFTRVSQTVGEMNRQPGESMSS
jgi:hypothetical protein